jgi:DNA-binding beta-propeller fold protein YncE
MEEGGNARNGLLAIIDVDMATRGMGQASIIRIISAGCAPVRAVETADGQHLFVAARGRNKKFPIANGYQVLVFDVPTLLSDLPNNGFVGYGSSGGTAPVGMALFNNETKLAVANSNRFHANCECRENPEQCTANVAILDVSNPGSPTVQEVVNPYNPNPNSPDFPRNVTVGPDDSTLYVPNAGAMKLEVITTGVK